MCYSPLQIINPTKYISIRHRDRYLLQVPCGHCAQCQRNKSNEWYYRAYYHAVGTLSSNSSNHFILFDTLTYRDADLPHMSDFVPLIERGTRADYPCFNSSHLRHFVTALRQKVVRSYGSNFTYFVTSEYGTSEHHTHRPHYHILLYVDGGRITPLQLSQLVATYWRYGRTDGIPYKSAAYVMKNAFMTLDDSTLRTCRYVSKYVQKSSLFDKEISRRIVDAMEHISLRMPEGWRESVNGKQFHTKLKRLCGQFHRQSTQFGSYALSLIDLDNLYKTGSLWMPDAKQVLLPIGLPTYYKRKLFYQTVTIDGNIAWVPTEDGEKWLQLRQRANYVDLVNRYHSAALGAGIKIDAKKLAKYTLFDRGRINVNERESNLIERAKTADYFNYVTPSDRLHLGSVGVTPRWCGNNTIGYNIDNLPAHYKPSQFISKFVYIDEKCDKKIDVLTHSMQSINKGKQAASDLRQRLTNLYHHLAT